MKGLLVVNKKSGVSSSNVVVKVKKILKTKKVGHMGTLDPLASGVLVLGVGKATRLFERFLKKKKRYLATFKFGEETDTLDLEGKVVKVCKNLPNRKEIEEVLPSFLGVQEQMPPEFSSKKVDGKRAYDLVRSGKEVSLKPCQIEIYEMNLVEQVDDSTFVFDIFCSSGTYIRSIARDIGKRLNSCATMIKLIRTECGKYSLNDCVDLDVDFTYESIASKIVGLDDVLDDLQKIYVNKTLLKDILDGKKVFVDSDVFLKNSKGFVFDNKKDKEYCCIVKNEKNNVFKINKNEKQYVSCESEEYCLICDKEIVGICKIDEDKALKICTFLYD